MKKILLCTMTFSLFMLTGCESVEEKIPYNAIVVEKGFEFREDFLKENTTLNGEFLHPIWDTELEQWLYGREDELAPKFRTHIIKEQSEFDEVFNIFPRIDFEKEMILIYVYTCYTNGRPQEIRSIQLDGNTLKIGFVLKKTVLGPDVSSPIRRFLVIKMDKLNIITVEFIQMLSQKDIKTAFV